MNYSRTSQELQQIIAVSELTAGLTSWPVEDQSLQPALTPLYSGTEIIYQPRYHVTDKALAKMPPSLLSLLDMFVDM